VGSIRDEQDSAMMAVAILLALLAPPALAYVGILPWPVVLLAERRDPMSSRRPCPPSGQRIGHGTTEPPGVRDATLDT
jgi:hypothetical protein